MFPMSLPLDLEPREESQIARLAERAGVAPDAYLYDHLTQCDGSNVATLNSLGYAANNLDAMHDMLDHPLVISGLGDGGAHLGLVCDASMTTSQLTFWGRDRARGPILPLEKVIANMTGKNANLYGFADRGTIAIGKKADINVIDFDNLRLDMPRVHRDLPNGGMRLLQASRGYLATMVNGSITRRNDTDTGARPGRLIRGGR